MSLEEAILERKSFFKCEHQEKENVTTRVFFGLDKVQFGGPLTAVDVKGIACQPCKDKAFDEELEEDDDFIENMMESWRDLRESLKGSK
jgi:hypothetical protein